jgi:hypothetical protein
MGVSRRRSFVLWHPVLFVLWHRVLFVLWHTLLFVLLHPLLFVLLHPVLFVLVLTNVSEEHTHSNFPEVVGDIFLRNFGNLLQDYTASNPEDRNPHVDCLFKSQFSLGIYFIKHAQRLLVSHS